MNECKGKKKENKIMFFKNYYFVVIKVLAIINTLVISKYFNFLTSLFYAYFILIVYISIVIIIIYLISKINFLKLKMIMSYCKKFFLLLRILNFSWLIVSPFIIYNFNNLLPIFGISDAVI